MQKTQERFSAYLLHPCSRKESIQRKGGPLPLESSAPRFHRGLPEGPSLALWQRAASLPRPCGQESLGTSLSLALRVLRMQIGFPADLSRRKLRCSARQTGSSPCHCKCLLLNRVSLTMGVILNNRELL